MKYVLIKYKVASLKKIFNLLFFLPLMGCFCFSLFMWYNRKKNRKTTPSAAVAAPSKRTVIDLCGQYFHSFSKFEKVNLEMEKPCHACSSSCSIALLQGHPFYLFNKFVKNNSCVSCPHINQWKLLLPKLSTLWYSYYSSIWVREIRVPSIFLCLY